MEPPPPGTPFPPFPPFPCSDAIRLLYSPLDCWDDCAVLVVVVTDNDIECDVGVDVLDVTVSEYPFEEGK